MEEFINSLEETFGKYRQGMRKAIEEKLCSVNQSDFDNLLKYLLEDYDMARPPSLKVILGEIYRHNILLNRATMYGISVCEFCGQEFSQNVIVCPKCQKLRKYGVTRLVRYKPVWIDFELDDEKEFMKKWNRENKA